MKKLTLSLALIFIIFFGCREELNITEPVESVGIENQQTNEPNWLKLGIPEGAKLTKKTFASQLIDGAVGGTITVDTEYAGGDFGQIAIWAQLTFHPGSFDGVVEITMNIDDEYLYTDFGPHMVFNQLAEYSVIYTGVNTTGLVEDSLRVAFLAPDGSYEFMETDEIDIDHTNGTVQLLETQIPHFSRYGLTR